MTDREAEYLALVSCAKALMRSAVEYRRMADQFPRKAFYLDLSRRNAADAWRTLGMARAWLREIERDSAAEMDRAA